METVSNYTEEFKFLKSCFSNWKDVPEKKISFQRLNSLSNVIYKVTADTEVIPKSIILRKFGKNDTVVDKDKEAKVFDLFAETGLGPKCYAKNSEYRCEEYLESDLIKNSQINEPYWRRKLAIVIAKHHAMSVPGVKRSNVMLERIKDTNLLEVINEKCALDGFSGEQIKLLDEMKLFGSKEEQELAKTIVPTENLVFSHNDIHAGNILITKPERKVFLIDYEFCDYNNRAFDGACLFVTSMLDFEFPSPPYFSIDPKIFSKFEDITDFAMYYLYASRLTNKEIEELEKDEARLNDNSWLHEKIKSELNGDGFETELKTYLEEFQKCCLLCHYDAILWGILMCEPKKESFCFDYLQYAYDRSKYYLRWRERFFKGGSIFE